VKIQNANLKSQNDNSKFKIGIPREYFGEGLDAGVKKVIEGAIDSIKKEGNEIIEISLPNAQYALEVYYIIMFVEVASNLARYDGIKYGRSAKNAKNLMEVYLKSRAEENNIRKLRFKRGLY